MKQLNSCKFPEDIYEYNNTLIKDIKHFDNSSGFGLHIIKTFVYSNNGIITISEWKRHEDEEEFQLIQESPIKEFIQNYNTNCIGDENTFNILSNMFLFS